MAAAVVTTVWAAIGNQSLLTKLQVEQARSIIVDFTLDSKAIKGEGGSTAIQVDVAARNNGAHTVEIATCEVSIWIGSEIEADNDAFPILQMNRPGEIGLISWKKKLVEGHRVFGEDHFVSAGLQESSAVSWKIRSMPEHKYICVEVIFLAQNNVGERGSLQRKSQIAAIK